MLNISILRCLQSVQEVPQIFPRTALLLSIFKILELGNLFDCLIYIHACMLSPKCLDLIMLSSLSWHLWISRICDKRLIMIEKLSSNILF
jgi:hypothetical protein